MSSAGAPAPTDAKDEIASLIEALHDTERRLEQLTSGEVDAVVSRDGRTSLLRNAQERLRVSQASWQEAILNALPASIALLDASGLILAVNRPWGEGGNTTPMTGPGHRIGANYLEFCDREFPAVAEGVRAVLSGSLPEYALAYCSGSGPQRRWYQLTTTALASRDGGAVLMHVDVTARKQADENLQASDLRFEQMAQHIRDVFFLCDLATGNILYVSPAYEEIWGRSCASLYEDPGAWADAIHPEDRATVDEDPSAGFELDYRIVRPDGTVRWIAVRGFPVPDAAGNVIRIAGVAEDVTQRRDLERSVRERERHFHFLDDLAEATRALIEPEQIMAVMTRMLGNHLQASRCAYADVAGDGERFTILNDFTDGCASSAGSYQLSQFGSMASSTLKRGKTFVIRNVTTEVPQDDGGKTFQAIRIEAVIVCPLVKNARLKAMMAVHQTMARDWTPSEVAIVQEVVERCWSTIERRSAEDRLRASEALLRIAGRTAQLGGWAISAADRHIVWSEEVCRLLEVPRGTSPSLDLALSFCEPKSRVALAGVLEQCLRDGTPFALELEMLSARGRRWWAHCTGEVERDRDGSITRAHGALQDISEPRGASEKLRASMQDLQLAELKIMETNQALRESERRFSNMLGTVQLASIMLDVEARITYCNDYFLSLTGWRHEEVLGSNWFQRFVPPECQSLREVFAARLADPPLTWHRESEILTRAGERRLIRWNISTLRSAAGAVIGTASIGEDITARKDAEGRIKHLNRVFTVLRGINSLIVRVADRDELFREACRIAVADGGFSMAMICVVERDSKDFEPVASAGKDDELIAAIKSVLTSSGRGDTMVARSLALKQPVVSNDSRNDSAVLLRERYAAAGVRSLAVFPLLVGNEAIGVFALYAGETEFFHEQEMKLLTELTTDVAFAVDHLEKGEKLHFLAYYDAITGLANRVLFHERLTQALVDGGQQQRKVALVLLDLERFRTITDTFGRQAGDALLRDVAGRLSNHGPEAGRVARIDADHFAIMLPDPQTPAALGVRIEQLVLDVFGSPFLIGAAELRVATKLGVATFPTDGKDADALFRNAEAALKNAKAGGERYLFYTPSMNERVAERLAMENQLRHALERDEFVLHYQPKVSVATGQLVSCEALIRWNDPLTGQVPPGRFISILEESGLILDVGRWALRTAISDYLRWRAAGLAAVRVAVNVSPLQLRSRSFVAEIRELISVHEHAPAALELEITEGMLMEDLKHSTATLQEIRAMGITVAIDDFGTGFSSLSYLARLPVDTLKIDQSFMKDMALGGVGLALVSTIITLAHAVKLNVVAEGVETQEQLRLLRELNCDEMQGFVLSKSLPGDVFAAKFLGASGGAASIH